jgi:hypothetical protein
MTKSHRQIKHAKKKSKQKMKKNKQKSLATKAENCLEKRDKRELHLLQKEIQRLQNKDFAFKKTN